MDRVLRKEITDFIARTKSVVIAAVKEGAPIVKAVTRFGNEGFSNVYFSTSAKSEFILAYKTNPAACAYMFDDDHIVPYPSNKEKYFALTLFGKVSEVTDIFVKERFINDYLKQYYPKGAEDENFSLFRFDAVRGLYFRGVIDNELYIDFDIKEENMNELKEIMEKFVESGWDLISIPAKAWLEGRGSKTEFIEAVTQADKECGSCGCEYDPLYKRALELTELF